MDIYIYVVYAEWGLSALAGLCAEFLKYFTDSGVTLITLIWIKWVISIIDMLIRTL